MKPEKRKVYKVPLYQWIPIIAIADSLFVLISTMIHDPLSSLLAIGVTLAGIPDIGC
ncbi:hypothetical protein [Thermoflavimicrobium dichotomicum]|uniref:hypothetical protein n=1 Tax=Thermoflavimicrobium dichotomicum TaxID=46223 RepID=UPI001587E8ED|nr:hypothetical protein [Thermoflavimicrobium dichotomicum]